MESAPPVLQRVPDWGREYLQLSTPQSYDAYRKLPPGVKVAVGKRLRVCADKRLLTADHKGLWAATICCAVCLYGCAGKPLCACGARRSLCVCVEVD